MTFDKQYIKKIINEEIKNALGMTAKLKTREVSNRLEQLRKRLIEVFIDYRESVTSMRSTSREDTRKRLERDLEDIKNDYPQLKHLDYPKFFVFCVHILEGHATGPLITFIKTIARGDRRFGPYQDKLDAYDHSITPELEKRPPETNDPDPGFMRVPKTDNARSDQLDTRKDRKNLSMS